MHVNSVGILGDRLVKLTGLWIRGGLSFWMELQLDAMNTTVAVRLPGFISTSSDCDESVFALYDTTANNLWPLFVEISIEMEIEIPEARLENLPRKYHPTLLPKL